MTNSPGSCVPWVVDPIYAVMAGKSRFSRFCRGYGAQVQGPFAKSYPGAVVLVVCSLVPYLVLTVAVLSLGEIISTSLAISRPTLQVTARPPVDVIRRQSSSGKRR